MFEAAAAAARRARLRLVGRRLLARADETARSTSRGRPRASRPRSTRATRPRPSARSTRSRPRIPICASSGCARRSSSSAKPRRDPAAVRRPVPALAARAALPDAAPTAAAGLRCQASTPTTSRRRTGSPPWTSGARRLQRRRRSGARRGELGRALGARPLRVPVRARAAAAGLTWRLRLQPTPPGWLDMGMAVPADGRARGSARSSAGRRDTRADDALLELLAGCATAPARRRRRSSRARAGRCACASSRRASEGEGPPERRPAGGARAARSPASVSPARRDAGTSHSHCIDFACLGETAAFLALAFCDVKRALRPDRCRA